MTKNLKEGKNYRDFIIYTAKEAGELLMENYGEMQELEWTAKQHFRTEVDKMSDRLIRRRIAENFPGHNIYSEEDKDLERNSEFSWVIDPLDGTIPYGYGISDHFSVCIALAEDKMPILGVVYAPKREELYVAEQGKGAFCNNEPIKISLEENVNRVIMGLDDGKENETFKRASFAKCIERFSSADGIACYLRYGCASVPLCFVASGKMHAYMAASLEPWDMAAAVIINREAGAKVSNLQGEEWTLKDASILVANPVLHSKLYNLLKA